MGGDKGDRKVEITYEQLRELFPELDTARGHVRRLYNALKRAGFTTWEQLLASAHKARNVGPDAWATLVEHAGTLDLPEPIVLSEPTRIESIARITDEGLKNSLALAEDMRELAKRLTERAKLLRIKNAMQGIPDSERAELALELGESSVALRDLANRIHATPDPS